jgi:hypothetical protein
MSNVKVQSSNEVQIPKPKSKNYLTFGFWNLDFAPERGV